MDDEQSIDMDLEPPPVQVARKRSSILRARNEERPNRESRTVSFDDRYMYKELHPDGTCEITNIFMHQDMDITQMDYVEPMSISNSTMDGTMDMSIQCSTARNSEVAPPQSENSTLSGECMDLTLIEEFEETIGPNMSSFKAPEISINVPDVTEDISFRVPANLSEVSELGPHLAALDACVQDVASDLEKSRKMLEEEMENLFLFHNHLVSRNNKYEFAIKIFGLRYGVWLIFKINPDTYPYEKLDLRFMVRRQDRHLYPFTTWKEAIHRTTRAGRRGYLTNFVHNAQRFRRFLRAMKRY